MKKSILLLLVLILGISLLAGCGGNNGGNNTPPRENTSGGNNTATLGLTGKYTLVSMIDTEGDDWMEMFNDLSELSDEGSEFDPNAFFIEFKSDSKCTVSITGDEAVECTYTVNGKIITITAEGENIKGTIEGNKITLEDADMGADSMKMIFEKK